MKSATLGTEAIHPGSTDSLADRLGPSMDIQVFLSSLPGLPEAALKGDAIIFPDRYLMAPIQRLVVLVPEGEIDENAFARRIWQLAVSLSLNIMYLAKALDDHQAVYQRRRLAGLAFITSDEGIQVQACVSTELSWTKALEKTQLPGDLLVCLASHQIPNHIIGRISLGKLLSKSVSVPVYTLAGLKIGLALYQRQRIKEILAWTTSLILLAIFFGLQAEIVHFTVGTTSTILLCLSVLVEVFSIYKINEWIG
jgi:hypothetical protein